ncbi:lysylphosphatidylglycerol synthase transmembrane domain-containing protein [Candidatus Electronema sp. TJ]|uniref:lysylphosphatidylglycerol synthase transmembrane domain-containing protein n=1 Tax=Candidatus Electronema sp. TJ TaxID=3401573 RepID=UPI003AA8E355
MNELIQQTKENPPQRGKKSRLFFFIKIAVSVLLLAYVIWKSGLDSTSGRDSLLQTLSQVNLFWLAFSIAVGVLLTVISSWKWQVLLRSKGIEVSLTRLVLFYFIGRFFNMFLPSSMGGDVVRVWELSRHSGEKYEALASVLVERLSGMTTLVFISAAAVLTHDYQLPILSAGVLFLAVMNAAIFWLILDQRILPLLSRLFGSRFRLAGMLLAKLSRLQDAVREYKDNKAVLIQVFAISCLFYFMAVVNVWGTALAFFPDMNFYSMLLAVPAIMLVMNLPVSIGGIGLMEAAFTFFFPLFGYSAALAVSTALLMRLKNILYGIAGGFLHLGRLRASSGAAQ